MFKRSWPQYRGKLLNNIIDEIASRDQTQIYAEIPHSDKTFSAGFRKVTYAAFANAINGIAWWLENELGYGNSETLVYIGPNDLRHVILLFGAVKAGYQVHAMTLPAA